MAGKPRYTDEFLQFWAKYPGRYCERTNSYPKKNKYLASKEWSKLSKNDRKQALYSASKLNKGRYVKDAFRWLRDKMFDDYNMPKGWTPALPKEMTANILKIDRPDTRSTSDKVNEQYKKLAESKG